MAPIMVISNDLLDGDVADLPVKLRVFQEFTHAIDRMAAGEYVDTIDEGKQIDIAELEYIHQNKTGALLKLCVRMGAILAGANDDKLSKLTAYADKIGDWHFRLRMTSCQRRVTRRLWVNQLAMTGKWASAPMCRNTAWISPRKYCTR